jgi:hypothetical protein
MAEENKILKICSSNKDLIELARITENAERYEDMCTIMGKLVKNKSKEGLEVEERNMLSVAYKNVVGARRASWRTLKASDDENDNNNDELREKYREQVESELKGKCLEVLALLQENLVSKEEDVDKLASEAVDDEAKMSVFETQVFYLKMCGDYYRYLAEFSDDDEFKAQAENKYKSALKMAENLAATHPTRLGLALNASVCYYEILKKPQDACKLAKDAFDQAIQKLDTLNDSSYKDSTLIMQLLRDNLTIWTSEDVENQGNIEPTDD